MSDKKRLFGTFGVRRTANDVLTPEFASRLAACYGTLVKGTVAVGGDTRTSTLMLKQAVTAGLLSSGCDVVDLGILPTPGVQYAVRKYYDGGVMITASHNPPQYNGLKFLDEDGIGIPDEMDIEIERLYFDAEPDRVEFHEIGELYQNDKVIDEYVDEAVSKVDVEAIRKANLKVVVDCGSGAGCFTAPYLIRKLGCDVTTLNSQPDGFFPGRNPEPSALHMTETPTGPSASMRTEASFWETRHSLSLKSRCLRKTMAEPSSPPLQHPRQSMTLPKSITVK